MKRVFEFLENIIKAEPFIDKKMKIFVNIGEKSYEVYKEAKNVYKFYRKVFFFVYSIFNPKKLDLKQCLNILKL